MGGGREMGNSMTRLKGKILFDYDREADVLYSFINKPRSAECREKGHVVLRLDPKSKKIVGFTVVDYRYKLSKGLLKSIPYFSGLKIPSFEENT